MLGSSVIISIAFMVFSCQDLFGQIPEKTTTPSSFRGLVGYLHINLNVIITIHKDL